MWTSRLNTQSRNTIKGKNVVGESEVAKQFVEDNEKNVCESEDGFRSVHESDDEERLSHIWSEEAICNSNFKAWIDLQSKQ